MSEDIYKIIDDIEKTDFRKELENAKKMILSDERAKKLLKEFYDAKKMYEDYGAKDVYLNAKKSLMENGYIKKYLDLQNDLNMLALYINNRILFLTGNLK